MLYVNRYRTCDMSYQRLSRMFDVYYFAQFAMASPPPPILACTLGAQWEMPLRTMKQTYSGANNNSIGGFHHSYLFSCQHANINSLGTAPRRTNTFTCPG